MGVKDVAARAGVSVGTVSNVLNRPELVSAPTKSRVLQAIAELGFVRNESGRQLRAGRSRSIAYVMLDAANPFFTDVAKGIEDVARVHGVAVFICNSDGDASRESEYLDLLLQQRVRGILVTPVDQDTTPLDGVLRQGLPGRPRGPRRRNELVQCRSRRRRGRDAGRHPSQRTGASADRLRGWSDDDRAGDRSIGGESPRRRGEWPLGRRARGDRDDGDERGRGQAGRRTPRRVATGAATDGSVLRQRPAGPRVVAADDPDGRGRSE